MARQVVRAPPHQVVALNINLNNNHDQQSADNAARVTGHVLPFLLGSKHTLGVNVVFFQEFQNNGQRLEDNPWPWLSLQHIFGGHGHISEAYTVSGYHCGIIYDREQLLGGQDVSGDVLRLHLTKEDVSAALTQVGLGSAGGDGGGRGRRHRRLRAAGDREVDWLWRKLSERSLLLKMTPLNGRVPPYLLATYHGPLRWGFRRRCTNEEKGYFLATFLRVLHKIAASVGPALILCGADINIKGRLPADLVRTFDELQLTLDRPADGQDAMAFIYSARWSVTCGDEVFGPRPWEAEPWGALVKRPQVLNHFVMLGTFRASTTGERKERASEEVEVDEDEDDEELFDILMTQLNLGAKSKT